jgi:hypothetical protein
MLVFIKYKFICSVPVKYKFFIWLVGILVVIYLIIIFSIQLSFDLDACHDFNMPPELAIPSSLHQEIVAGYDTFSPLLDIYTSNKNKLLRKDDLARRLGHVKIKELFLEHGYVGSG